MLVAAFAALLSLQQVDVSVRVRFQADSLPLPADSLQGDTVPPADAYLDPGARALVRAVRERRAGAEHRIEGYRALARERISAGISALRRERLLFRRETAAHIEWRRFGVSRVEVLGARDALPIAFPGVRVPEDLDAYVPHLVFDPADDRLIGFPDGEFLLHPLAPGSECDYRFASGDTTQIRLPDGRQVLLYELRFLPRRSESRLLSGAFWVEAESHAVVQALFRLARAYDLERDADDPDDADDIRQIPGLLKPIQADFRYMTIDYGLWEMRWWLPRRIAFEGYASIGSFVDLPLRYERSYTDYEVVGDSSGLPQVRLALAGAPAAPRCRDEGCWCNRGRCRRVEVSVPGDSASLLASPLLPPSAFQHGQALLSESELRDLAGLLDRLPGAPPELRTEWHWGLGRPGLLRYNRIEGLSLGARADAEFGALSADLTARLGVADLEPGAELGLAVQTPSHRYRLAGYRHLAAVDPAAGAFGLGNSLGALVLGRDDGDYLRVLGAELSATPARGRTPWYDLRLYAERQRPAAAETRFSLRRLVDGDAAFRPNLQADRADQLGAALALRVARGLDPAGWRWGAALTVEGETGTYRFVRPAAVLRLNFPLPGSLVAAAEAGAGTSFGSLPAQRAWFLGGPATLRGYAPLAAAGSAYWRARGEVATSLPAARLALFSDAGWAGDRGAFSQGRPLLSAGIGASLLDGLIRFDIARALRAPRGWRADFYLDAAL